MTHWNGIPIDRAVNVNAARFAGSNPDAQHSRGLQSLTIRPLIIHLPPDEEWVTVSYLAPDGSPQTLRHDWMVVTNLPPFTGNPNEVSATAATLGLDLDADEAGRAKTLLFAPTVAQAWRAAQPATLQDEPVAPGQELTTAMPGVFRARPVQTSSGVFGHIRIFTFSVNDPDAFVEEFIRLIGLLPQNGLIVDVRDNGGGHIHASEFTLQTLTPRRIQPEPVQFASRDLNLAICRRHKDNPSGIDLGPWFASLDQATETGAEYSGAFPITPVAGANARGQHYHGPVVLITNARCYSATDIFAAGFADHQIGTILGVDNNTGAGGANVWTHGLLTQLLQLPTPDPTSPYVALPNGANMRVSIRRTLRVGEHSAGTPVEDLGVTPDELHRMTRRDVLDGNADLLDRAGVILAQGQPRRLDVFANLDDDGALHVEVDAAGIDRVDAYVDDRPRVVGRRDRRPHHLHHPRCARRAPGPGRRPTGRCAGGVPDRAGRRRRRPTTGPARPPPPPQPPADPAASPGVRRPADRAVRPRRGQPARAGRPQARLGPGPVPAGHGRPGGDGLLRRHPAPAAAGHRRRRPRAR